MKYLKVWTSFREVIEPLADDEKGRLFDAMLLYADQQEEPEAFQGNERFVWPAAKQWIDLTLAESIRLTENGKKGGRPRKQAESNKTKENQDKPNETHNIKKSNVIENNGIFIIDDEARKIQSEQNRVLDAAEDAGFQRSNTIRARLIALYADNGLQKMLDAINECVRHGAPNLAYLEAVLKGQPKKQKARIVAQDYDQRDYSTIQQQLIEEQNREMEEFLREEESNAG